MSDLKDFVIKDGTLEKYRGAGGDVVIPDCIKSIGEGAFNYCENVKSITIPNTVTKIGKAALYGPKLKQLILPQKLIIEEDIFWGSLPLGLAKYAEKLIPHFSSSLVKKYFLAPKIWKKITPNTQATLFMKYQSKDCLKSYQKCIVENQAEAFANAILTTLPQKATAKDCLSVANCIALTCTMISDSSFNDLYEWLHSQKNAQQALEELQNNVLVVNKLDGGNACKGTFSAEQLVINALIQEKIDEKALIERLKIFYGLTPKELPKLSSKDGTTVSDIVMAYLLTTHEEVKKQKGQFKVIPKEKTPGITETAAAVIEQLDFGCFESAISTLVDTLYLNSGTTKKKYLAFPVCRYANEKLMSKLVDLSLQWTTTLDVIFKYFYKAAYYNNTKSAVLFLDDYNGLDAYAAMRNTTVLKIRDTVLADFGLDSNTSIDIATLTDPFMKQVVKNQKRALFRLFLSGEAYLAQDWQEVYVKNPLMRDLAGRLVWVQNDKTFTVTPSGLTTSTEQIYELTSEEIRLAHPMEMKENDLDLWQKLFVKKQIKQPFEQIWEPVINPETFKSNRYAETPIPYVKLVGQIDRGITVKIFNEYNDVYFYFADCEVLVNRVDFERHRVSSSHRFVVHSLKFETFTRQVNHLLGYLDIVTAEQRVLLDDPTIVDVLPSFTYSNIMQMIKTANENKKSNVLAMLLDYKNKNFADFDPMEEFVLV